MRFSILVTAAAVGAASMVADTGPAHAQLIPNAAYEDAKSVISELITADVARNVVPNLVCRSGRTIAKEHEKKHIAIELSDKNSYVFELSRYYPHTLHRVFNRQFGNLRASVEDESAELAGHIVYRAITGAANTETLKAKIAETPEPEQAAATDEIPTFTALSDTDLNTCTKVVTDKMLDGSFLRDRQAPLTAVCNGTVKANNYACDVAIAVRALLQNKSEIAEEHLVRAAASVVMEVAKKAVPSFSVAAGQTPNFEQIVYERMLVATRDVVAKPDADAVAKFFHMAEDAFKRLDSAGNLQPYPGIDANDLTKLRNALAAVDRLRTQWQLATFAGTKKLDVAAFIEGIATAGSSLSAMCQGVATGACGTLTEQAKRIGPGTPFWGLIRAASRGDYRECAHLGVETLFAATTKTCESDDKCKKIALYRRFADGVVVYVLDIVEDKEPSDAARAAFRAAAVDVLQDVAQGGGFERKYWQTVIFPDLALRFSWSPGYISEDNDSSRIVASANLLNFRIAHRTPNSFSAVQFSLIDPLAPLSELAVRKSTNTDYERPSRLALNVLTPRIDLLFGIPPLSKHLVVGAGASLRLVAPLFSHELPTANPEAPTQVYRYQSFFYNVEHFAQFIEFGFTVKYLL